MKRLKPAGRVTPLWLVMGLFAGVGCGSAGSPPAEDTQHQTVSGALESYGPDLVVTEVHAPPSVRSGQPFTATVKVCNRGTDPATTYYNPVWLELYLSTDANLSLPGPGTPPQNDQRMVGSVDVPPLNPGQCTTRTFQAYASLPPDAQGDGAYFLGAIVDVFQSLQEVDETNNAHVSGLMGVGYRSDLVVTEVKGPASVRMGDPFAATVQVCNQGTEPTSGYGSQPRVELYLSTDADLSLPGPGIPPPNDQRMVGSVDVPFLGAGQCVTRTVNAQAYLPQNAQGDGAYHLGALVDVFQSEQELREDNNAHVAGLMGVGYRSDLVVTEVKGPASVQHGDSFTATVKVCNQGTQPTSGYSQSYLELYLSMDTTLTAPQMSGPGSPLPTDQRMVGHVAVPSLNAGQCATRTVMASAWLPQDAQGDGAYFLGAIVDAHQSEQELREDNNSLVGDLTGVGYRADLVVTEVRGPASARHGDPFTAFVKVCNQGTQPSGYSSTVELYLSMDTTLTPPQMSGPWTPQPSDQRLIGSVPVPSLGAGQCTTQPMNAHASTPPDAMGEGALYLGAFVDPFQSAQELREDNNSLVGGLMGVGYRSDLVVTEVSGPASARGGMPFTATVKVCNQGTETTSGYSSTVELYLSMDTTLTAPQMSGPPMPPPMDQRMIGSVQLPGLNAGHCVTRTVNAHAFLPPEAMGEGAFFLGAIVDPFQSEQELREDNNSLVGRLMGVGDRSDLVVTEVSGPASVPGGNAFTATVKVCNQGTQPTSGYSGQSRVELYLSMDTTLTPPPMSGPGGPAPTDQRMVGFMDVPFLGAGQCVTRTVNAHAYLPQDAMGEGAVYLGAIVDPSQAEQELREDNNSFIGGLMGVGYRSDLVVAEVKGPASVRNGDTFTATVKVCNQGTQPSSYYSTVELYLSMDTTLTAPRMSGPWTPPPSDQRLIGAMQLPALGAGQCLSQTFNAYAHAPQAADPDGAFYLGAIVDPSQSEPELREDNNSLVGGLMGVGYRSDLVVTEVRGPTSIQPGTPFTASVKVCNQGTETTSGGYGGPRVELYLSMDTTLSAPVMSGPGMPATDQRLIGSVDLPQLNAGQCVTRDVSAHASTPQDFPGDGALYLGAIVDPFQSEQELREDNNAFIGGLMGVGFRSDLVVTQVSGPASAHDGEPFTARVKVCNQGTEFSGAIHGTYLELYLSTDTALTAPMLSGPGMPPPTDQRMIASVSVPSLNAGQCTTLDVSAHAYRPPDAMGDGAFYLGAILDPFQAVPELREDNNTFIGGLMGVGELPDLVVTEVKGPANVRPGDSFTATVKVCNQGTQPAGSYSSPSLSLYLSTDDALSFPPGGGPGMPPTDQQMVASESLPPLQPGACTTRSMQAYVSLPPDAHGEGPVFLGAIVDGFVSVQELREDNNTRVGGLMGVGNRSDLVVTEVSAPASVRPGAAFTASVKVCNQGTARSGLYSPGMPRLELYLSPGPALVIPVPGMPYPPSESQQLIGSTHVDPLDAGQCVTLSLPASAHVPPGAQDLKTLFLGAIVDASRMEQELREDNNVLVSGPMGVGLLADLVVTELSGPASARRGMPFTAQVKVCNQGTEPSNASGTARLEVYLSTEASLTVPTPGMPPPQGGQMMVGSLSLVPLVPGQCETLAVQASANPPPDAPWDGAVFLGAIVDVHGAVSELREDNNVTVGGRMGVGERPDLVVTAVSAPTSVRHGDAFTASVTVCNQGTTPSGNPYGATQLGLFLSTGTTLSPMGPGPMPMDQGMVGSVQLNPLAPGQCTTVGVQARAYPPPTSQGAGSFFLGAYVDPYVNEYELREDNNARADFAFQVTW